MFQPTADGLQSITSDDAWNQKQLSISPGLELASGFVSPSEETKDASKPTNEAIAEENAKSKSIPGWILITILVVMVVAIVIPVTITQMQKRDTISVSYSSNR